MWDMLHCVSDSSSIPSYSMPASMICGKAQAFFLVQGCLEILKLNRKHQKSRCTHSVFALWAPVVCFHSPAAAAASLQDSGSDMAQLLKGSL